MNQKAFPKASQEALTRWTNNIAEPFILYLGALRSYKGLETLIEAARDFRFKLVIAGSGKNLDKLREMARNAKLNNIDFLGSIYEDDKAALLELCTALVLPSHFRSEAFGLVQLEAAMKKKPLICTELGTGTSYVNEHENTGLVVPPKDVDALLNAMNFMMYHPEVAKNMGIAAEARFKELFTAKLMCENYARIYKEVAARSSLYKE